MDSGYESLDEEQCEACMEQQQLIAAIEKMKETYANLEAAAKALGDREEEKKFNEGYNICNKYLQDGCVVNLLCGMCIKNLDKDLNSIEEYLPNSVRYILHLWQKLG